MEIASKIALVFLFSLFLAIAIAAAFDFGWWAASKWDSLKQKLFKRR